MKPRSRIGILLTAVFAVASAQSACYSDLTGAPADRPYMVVLDPSAVVAGGAAFTLTVKGYGFLPSDLLAWEGSPKTATFVSSQQLTAQIAATDIARAGVVQVAVYRVGGSYDALYLVVKSPTP